MSDDPKAILGRFQERMPAPKPAPVAQSTAKVKRPKREPVEKAPVPRLSELEPIRHDETIDPERLGRSDD